MLALFATGCVAAVPTASEYPAPVASAAQPSVTGRGDIAYAKRGAEAIRQAISRLGTDEAVRRLPEEGLTLADAAVEAACTAADGNLPVLVCHFGPERSRPVAQVIVWYERDGWEAQLYPQAPETPARERQQAFAELGCRLGYYSGISRVREARGPDGRQLLVVVDMGFAGEVPAEEVQVLRLRDGIWEVQWVPGAGDWNYGHARVSLAPGGIDHFDVQSSSWLRKDRLSGYLAEGPSSEHRLFEDRWVRKGSGYLLRDRVERESPYSALLRLIHYLSTGADEKALALLDPAIDLEDARRILAQKPRGQRWAVTRWGESGFLIDTRQGGKPDVQARFGRRDGQWVLVEVRPAGD